jgi:hypothetical protein
MATKTHVPLDPESLKIPAIFTNHFQILATGGNVRITFAEAVGVKPGDPPSIAYHLAVALTLQDARELAEGILASLTRTPPSADSPASLDTPPAGNA